MAFDQGVESRIANLDPLTRGIMNVLAWDPSDSTEKPTIGNDLEELFGKDFAGLLPSIIKSDGVDGLRAKTVDALSDLNIQKRMGIADRIIRIAGLRIEQDQRLRFGILKVKTEVAIESGNREMLAELLPVISRIALNKTVQIT